MFKPGLLGQVSTACTHLHGQSQLLDPVLPFLRPGARFLVVPPQKIAPYQEAGLPLLRPVPHNLWEVTARVSVTWDWRWRRWAVGTGRTSHLVDAVVPVTLGGGVFAVLAALDVAHHPDWLPRAPVLGLGPFAFVDGGAAVESQCPAGEVGGHMLSFGLYPPKRKGIQTHGTYECDLLWEKGVCG